MMGRHMSIRVDASLRRAMRQHPGAIGIRVEGAPPEVAADALRRLRGQLLRVDSDPRWGPALGAEGIPGIPYVSGVSLLPSGAGLWFDGKDVPAELLDWTVDELVGHLRSAEVTDARVTAPPRSRLAASDPTLLTVPNAVSLRLFPDPPVVRNGVPSPISEAWLRRAFDWLRDQVPELEDLSVVDLLIDEQVELDDARAFMERARARQATQAFVIAGRPDRVLATIGGYFAVSASVCLSVAGRGLDEASLLARIAQLGRTGRDLAPELSLAMVSVEQSLGRVLGTFPAATIWQDSDGAQPSVVYHLCDELLFDAYPSQVLGPGHLRRLGRPPAGAVPLGAGRFEYAAGDARHWLPGRPQRDSELAAARRALAPCLVTNAVASELFHARWPRPQVERR
jgi:hypothetical protein